MTKIEVGLFHSLKEEVSYDGYKRAKLSLDVDFKTMYVRDLLKCEFMDSQELEFLSIVKIISRPITHYGIFVDGEHFFGHPLDKALYAQTPEVLPIVLKLTIGKMTPVEEKIMVDRPPLKPGMSLMVLNELKSSVISYLDYISSENYNGDGCQK